MALHPQVAELLARVRRAGHAEFPQLGAVAAREAYRRAAKVLDIAPLPMLRVDDFAVRTAHGPLPLRVYVPRVATAAMPAVLYFHGGGFTIGSLETHDAVCRMLAQQSDSMVVAVDYRLAPEHPFPAAVDDAFFALRWLKDHARRLHIDAQRIAVAGDSAGGTLAAVCAIEAPRIGLALAHQLLIYPGTGAYQDTPSHQRFKQGYLLDATTIQWFFGHYLSDPAQRLDWRFAPLDAQPAPQLAGLAPATVMVAEFDPLHDEGVAYATRLQQAGVAVELLDYAGMVHGFFQFAGVLDVARQAHRDAGAVLRKAFALHGATAPASA